MIRTENFNEKVVQVLTTIFACGSSQFKEMKNEEEQIIIENMEGEHVPGHSGLKRNSIHFSMMLDHLQNLWYLSFLTRGDRKIIEFFNS